jgi:hypothetical protein
MITAVGRRAGHGSVCWLIKSLIETATGMSFGVEAQLLGEALKKPRGTKRKQLASLESKDDCCMRSWLSLG